jgi:hypothetical protein
MSTAKTLSAGEYQERLAKLKTMKDVNAFVKELIAPTLQQMLEAEMTVLDRFSRGILRSEPDPKQCNHSKLDCFRRHGKFGSSGNGPNRWERCLL